MKKKMLGIGGGITAYLLLTPTLLSQATSIYPTDLACQNAEVTTLFSDLIRWLVWGVVKLGYRISTFFETALNRIFEVSPTLVGQSSFSDLTNQVLKVSLVFLSLIIVFIAFKSILQNRRDNLRKLMINLVIVGSVMVATTTAVDSSGLSLMGYLSEVTQLGIKSLTTVSADVDSGLSKQLILDQLVDLDYVIKEKSNEKLNTISVNKFEPNYFDYTEVLNRDSINKKYPNYNQVSGQWEEKELNNGVFGFFEQNVYRYTLRDPFILVLNFLVISLGFIFAGLKYIRLIIELGFKQVLLGVVGIFDIENGQRFKRLLTSIGTTFLMLPLTLILFRCYQLGMLWVSRDFGLTVSPDQTGIFMYMKLLGYIACVIMLLDGPKIVEELFGMDIGISGEAVRTGSHLMNIGRGVGEVKDSVTESMSNAKQFMTDPTKGQRTKKATKMALNGAGVVGQQMAHGASKVAHFKGFDYTDQRQSLAEMGQNAWDSVKATAGRVNNKAQSIGFDAKMKFQESERVQGVVSQAKDFSGSVKQKGKEFVDAHYDQLQPKAQQLQVMNQLQTDKLATEKRQFADKQALYQDDQNQRTESPQSLKTSDEMTRSEKFEQKWNSSSNLSGSSKSESVSVPNRTKPYANLTWKESLQQQLIDSGNAHLLTDQVKEMKKEAIRQRLRQINQRR